MKNIIHSFAAVVAFSVISEVSYGDLVIDTDGGVDDGVTVLMVLGDPTVHLKAITCVAGITLLKNCVRNMQKLLQLTNNTETVRVFAGSDYNMVRNTEDYDFYGTDGFFNVNVSSSSVLRKTESVHAAVFLAQIVRDNPGTVTVMTLGPLTNIALAIHINKQFLQQVNELVVQGGYYKGSNIAPGAEFNMFADPEGASLVFNRSSVLDLRITLFPLDTIENNPINVIWRWTTLGCINSTKMDFVNKVEMKALQRLTDQPDYYRAWATYVGCYVLNPKFVLESENTTIFVEYRGLKTRGVVILDRYNLVYTKKNVNAIKKVDMKVYRSVLERVLS